MTQKQMIGFRFAGETLWRELSVPREGASLDSVLRDIDRRYFVDPRTGGATRRSGFVHLDIDASDGGGGGGGGGVSSVTASGIVPCYARIVLRRRPYPRPRWQQQQQQQQQQKDEQQQQRQQQQVMDNGGGSKLDEDEEFGPCPFAFRPASPPKPRFLPRDAAAATAHEMFFATDFLAGCFGSRVEAPVMEELVSRLVAYHSNVQIKH